MWLSHLRRKIMAFITRLLLIVVVLAFAASLFIAINNFLTSRSTAIVRELDSKRLASTVDKDADGLDDYADIVASARAQIGTVTSYDTSYYAGGYPPDDTGACADVIWRALDGTGYNFRTMIDTDMAAEPEAYLTSYDTNINFRRTQNIGVFLARNATSLTLDVVPNDVDNLAEWQGGDIVTFAQIPGGLWHVAIVSDKRRSDGVPYLIHNHGYGTKENNYLTNWPTAITGHYRFLLP